jgi:hypothetical protein
MLPLPRCATRKQKTYESHKACDPSHREPPRHNPAMFRLRVYKHELATAPIYVAGLDL